MAKHSRWSIRYADGSGTLFGNYRLEMIPAAIVAAVSVLLLLEGLLHMPSLPVMVMLFVGFSVAFSLRALTYSSL